MIGMPLALVLAFKYDMGVRGFWIGFSCALVIKETIVTLIIVCADWDRVISDDDAEAEKSVLIN